MKMKFILAGFFLLLFNHNLFAQSDSTAKTDGYFAAGFGMALPEGTFSSTSGINPGRYASPGTSTCISAGIIINKLHLGFAIKEAWFNCAFNAGNYILAAQAADSLQGRTFTRDGGDSKYSGGYGMIGLITDIHIHNLVLEFELLGGRLTAWFPEVTYTVSSGSTTTPPYDFAAYQSHAFAYEAGVSARLPFAKHFCAKVDFNFIHSTLPYASTEQFNNSLGTPVLFYVYYTCPISFITGTAGIAYKF